MIHCSVLLSKQNLSRCKLKVNIYYRVNHHEIFDQKKVTKVTDSVLFENDANVLFNPFTLKTCIYVSYHYVKTNGKNLSDKQQVFILLTHLWFEWVSEESVDLDKFQLSSSNPWVNNRFDL